jgi:hypothetical protein
MCLIRKDETPLRASSICGQRGCHSDGEQRLEGYNLSRVLVTPPERMGDGDHGRRDYGPQRCCNEEHVSQCRLARSAHGGRDRTCGSPK